MRRLAVLAALLIPVLPAAAWGPEGHALIADIAETTLTDSARREALRLLAMDGAGHLADIASWADFYRRDHPETGSWHFVDIPLDVARYDEDRDCHEGVGDQRSPEPSCVVAKIVDFASLLADHRRPDAERLIALNYVVHLVGDLHQPLHAEDNLHDRGGNLLKLTFRHASSNLHALWDSGILLQHYGWNRGQNFAIDQPAVAAAADSMLASLAPSDRRQWGAAIAMPALPALIVAWTEQAHAAAAIAYDRLPAAADIADTPYPDQVWPVIAEQLQKAGLRLGAVLNTALAEN